MQTCVAKQELVLRFGFYRNDLWRDAPRNDLMAIRNVLNEPIFVWFNSGA
ncbi:MAG: hypothetical protein BWY92_01472 [Firmicutes bacterium ADurb.BinA052]|nr:MAG: hypothetical protein BWY92_01472 [Firmicutes bacterium ADurb.BinA052]